jgi:transcription elongation factor GreA
MQEKEKTVLLTVEGRKKLEAELEHLKTVRRQEVMEQLQIARQSAEGWDSPDVLEAKNEQAFLEGRIRTLERMLAGAEILQVAPNTGIVRHGCEVRVRTEVGGEECYVIVGSAEAEPALHRISSESPVGKALMGRKIGEQVEFLVPDGKRSLVVLDIQ